MGWADKVCVTDIPVAIVRATGLRKFGGAALLCFGLAACGGSGSGGDGSAGPGGAPVVTPPQEPSISFDASATTFQKDRAAFAVHSNVFVTVRNTTTDKVFLSADYTKAALTFLSYDSHDPNSIRLEVSHRPPSELYNGSYVDRITVRACLDQACTQPLSGSPLVIPITYVLSGTDPATGATGPPADPDPDADPLTALSQVILTHNVVDAEYSRALDRVVMAASYPANALYLYDPATGSERSIPLSKAPTALSLSPDGLSSAVGHPGFISFVSLVQDPQSSQPRVFAVSQGVFDIALDGRDRAHFVRNSVDADGRMRTLDAATGTEYANTVPTNTNSPTFVRVHPAGDSLFQGDPLVSTITVTKWDITGPLAEYVNVGNAEKFGDCGMIWFDEPGLRLFNPCGDVFATDGPRTQKLPVLGRIELSNLPHPISRFYATGIDHSTARNEIALIESSYFCDYPAFAYPCHVRLRTYDGESLTPTSMQGLPPLAVDGLLHKQRGLFVFFNSNASRKILLSKLDALAEPEDGRYLLSVLE